MRPPNAFDPATGTAPRGWRVIDRPHAGEARVVYELERCGIEVLVLRTSQPRFEAVKWRGHPPKKVAAWAPEWALVLYEALESYAAVSRPTTPTVHGMSMQRYFALVVERPSLEKAIMAVWRLGDLKAVRAFMMHEALGLTISGRTSRKGAHDG